MYKQMLMVCLMGGLLISGCTSQNNQNAQEDTDQDTDMIQYESTKERQDRLNNGDNQPEYGKPDEKERINSGNDDGTYTDLFTTKESRAIADKLLQHPAIRQAQIAIKEEENEIVVAVMLAPGYNNDIRQTVKTDVENMMPNKKVTVYTDARYLNNKDDMNAKRNQSNIDGYIDEYLENFFGK